MENCFLKLQNKQNYYNFISDNCTLTRSMRFFSSPISSGSDTSLLLLTDSTSRQPRKHTAVERTDNWLRLYTKKKSVLTIHPYHHHHVAIPLLNVIAIMARWKDYWFLASPPTSYNFMCTFVLVDSYLSFQEECTPLLFLPRQCHV